MNKKRVLCAMSGGVDSSVTARLLLDAGYDVTGITMNLLPRTIREAMNSAEILDAKAVCEVLEIDHMVVAYQDIFRDMVIEPFCQAYQHGLTPNPCIECNKYLKFKALHNLREEKRFDYIATGHYARIVHNEANGAYELRRATDLSKDQSYVLYHLSSAYLAHTLLPLGSYTKAQVREIAAQSGFVNAQKAESQDICFIPSGDYAAFIEMYTKQTPQPGNIVDMQGRVLGQHRGLIHYTIGQRKGLGVSVGEPLFVVRKEPESNTLVVGKASEAHISRIEVSNASFISDKHLEQPCSLKAKINYRARLKEVIVQKTSDTSLSVTFTEPIRGAAPGQALVLYDHDTVLGGGTICATYAQ